MESHDIIINTTPVGMHPHYNNLPLIPYRFLNKRHLLYDLVYNPEMTHFLLKGKEAGSVLKNGLEMLHLQAEFSWSIWNGLQE